MPILSTIICTHNVVGRLERTLDSIVVQDFADGEIVVADGASTDGTVEALTRYEAICNGRLRWVSEPDRGIYDAMNKAVAMARGEYVNIIGAGDWIEDGILHAVADVVRGDPSVDAVYGKTRIWDRDRQHARIVQTMPCDLAIYPMQHPALYYRKTLHDTFGLYDTTYAIAADYLFCLKAFYKGHVHVEAIDRVASNFVKDGVSSRRKYTSLWENYRAKKAVGLQIGMWREFAPQVKNKVRHLCQK